MDSLFLDSQEHFLSEFSGSFSTFFCQNLPTKKYHSSKVWEIIVGEVVVDLVVGAQVADGEDLVVVDLVVVAQVVNGNIQNI